MCVFGRCVWGVLFPKADIVKVGDWNILETRLCLKFKRERASFEGHFT